MRYQIKHALVQYGANTIIEDVNFEIHDNEKIAVVGRNGCGKTTLLKLIAGDIHMNNLDSDEECGIMMAGKQEIGFLRQISFPDGEVTVEEEIKKTSYSKYFKCILASDAWLKAYNAESVYVTSADGLKLHAYWIPAEHPRGTVLLAHGYRSTMLVDFGLAYPFYHALGMNILVPHQRAHGESQGRYITFGVKESEDMKCWIDYHNKTYGCHQMILSGMSMGASTMLFLADQDLPDNVKCIIADCGFTSRPIHLLFHRESC